jgi:TRAP-type transport system small permease protein
MASSPDTAGAPASRASIYIASIQRTLLRIEETVAALMLLILTLLVIYQVWVRYVQNSPSIWSEEAARFLFIWVTFVGSAAALGRGEHVIMEVVYRQDNIRMQRIWASTSYFLTFSICAFMVPFTWQYAWNQQSVGSPALDFPVTGVWVSASVGFGLMSLHAAGSLLDELICLTSGSKTSSHAS